MVLLRFLRGRGRGKAPKGPSILSSIASRIPPGGAAGLLPAADPAQDAEELRLGRRFAEELHRPTAGGSAGLLGQGRRLAAITAAARRRSAPELEEALRGLAPWELPELVDALLERKDLDRGGLAQAARALAQEAGDHASLAAAIAMLGPGIEAADRELILLAGRSPAIAGIGALTLEPLPIDEGDRALLELAAQSEGLSRSLVLERLATRHLIDPEGFAPHLVEALSLAAAIEDPLERTWAAVPLIEVAELPSRLGEEPELAIFAAPCLEAIARGGWNGGPGPGLGRLPGATRAAEAILVQEGIDPEARLATARAVLDARPVPSGPAYATATKLLGP